MEHRMSTTTSSSFLRDRWPLLVLIGVVMIYPILTSQSYFIARLGVILVLYSIVLVGAILLIPFAGIVSMGQAAFFGMGAYISAILTVRLGMSPWLAMVIAAGGTTFAAYLFCAPFLKLRAIYLAIATLGLGEIVTLVIRELARGDRRGVRTFRDSLFSHRLGHPETRLADLLPLRWRPCHLCLSGGQRGKNPARSGLSRDQDQRSRCPGVRDKCAEEHAERVLFRRLRRVGCRLTTGPFHYFCQP